MHLVFCLCFAVLYCTCFILFFQLNRMISIFHVQSVRGSLRSRKDPAEGREAQVHIELLRESVTST